MKEVMSSSTFDFIAEDADYEEEEALADRNRTFSFDDSLSGRLLETTPSVRDVTENAWEVINTEFRKFKKFKASAMQELKSTKGKLYSDFSKSMENIHPSFSYKDLSKSMETISKEIEDKREVVRSELNALKIYTREKANRAWRRFKVNLQLFLLGAPAVYYVLSVAVKNPWIIVFAVIYLFCITAFIIWNLVVPPLHRKGINFFSKYEMDAEDKTNLENFVSKAQERMNNVRKQEVYNEKERERKTIVLSLDGGGIKGAVSARIIARICNEFPDFLDHVDLVAGCSIGSIIAGLIASGYQADELTDIFKIAAPSVFRTTVWEQLKQFGFLAGSFCDGCGKLDVFKKLFFGLKLSELRCGCIITASHVDDEHEYYQCIPRVWTNVVQHGDHAYVGHHDFEVDGISSSKIVDHKTNYNVLDMKLADVLNGATAAPLYFPTYQNHADGIFFSNNPSMTALSTLIPVRELQNVWMISISTGVTSRRAKPAFQESRFGLFQWLPFLFDFFVDATSTAAHFNVKSILQERYHRIDPILPVRYNINDVAAIDELIVVADSVDLSKTFQFLENMGLRKKLKKE